MQNSAAHQLLHELQDASVDSEFGVTLQRRYADLAKFLPKSVEDMANAAFGSNIPPLVNEIIQISGKKMPTPLESPARYALMSRMQVQIEKILSTPPLHPFVIGTLPSGNFNGMAIRVPKTTEEYLIVLESGLFNFLYRLGSVMNLVWPSGDKHLSCNWQAKTRGLESVLSGNMIAMNSFERLVLKYLVTGRPNGAFPIKTNASISHSQLVAASELFVLAHEYGHVMSGHLTNPTTKLRSVGVKQLAEVQNSWAEEFEADEKGFEFAVRAGALDGISPAMTCGGVALFFSSAEIITNSLSLVLTGEIMEVKSVTHPPCGERLNRIKQIAKDKWGIEACQFASSVQVILQAFGKAIVLSLQQHHKAHTKIAPAWKRTE
ncbi:MAG: hypothetical protein WDM80_02240 [Limisphaerales bacterium]